MHRADLQSGPDPEDVSVSPSPAEIRLAAMNLLARREHSLQELRRKLRSRFPDEDALEAELGRLAEENLQSDSRFAEDFARQRAARGYGPLRVQQEMREKGLSDAAIEDAFTHAGLDWYERAEEAYRKKFGPAPSGATAQAGLKEKARRVRFMQYRGFQPDHYRHLFDD